MAKPDLQEKALQLEIDIYHPEDEDGNRKELTVKELEAAIKAKEAELEAEAAEAEAQANAARDGDGDGDDDDDDDGDGDEPSVEEQRAQANAAMAADNKKARQASADSKTKATACRDPEPELLRKLGLTVSDADRKLARKHGYPVAVPGGQAFRTRVSFNCVFGGGLRPIDSIVLLTPSEADHKREFIEPVS